MKHSMWILPALGLLLLPGCAVVTVTSAVVSTAVTAVEVTTDVAVATGKGVVKAGSWAVNAASMDGGEEAAKTAATPAK